MTSSGWSRTTACTRWRDRVPDDAVREEMLRVPHRDVDDVDDDSWGATIVGDRLRVRGEIDAGNVDRFSQVLRSAVAAGVSKVDLSELDFLAVAGARALLVAAELTPGAGGANDRRRPPRRPGEGARLEPRG